MNYISLDSRPLLFFHYADSFRLLQPSIFFFLILLLFSFSVAIASFWLPFSTLNIWYLLSACFVERMGRGEAWRSGVSLPLLRFVSYLNFVYASSDIVVPVPGRAAAGQGCIKCFCGCKRELMRAKKETKIGRKKKEEIVAVASCNAFNLYARPGTTTK